MAVAAVERQIRWDDFLRNRRAEPAIGAMATKTRLIRHRSCHLLSRRSPAIVEVKTTDGRTLRRRVDYAKGRR